MPLPSECAMLGALFILIIIIVSRVNTEAYLNPPLSESGE